ncbi:LytTR family transcriptional regulator DNA-binding domain-containing protein, partial [Vibrio sp. 10N.261.48.A2]
CIGHNRIVIMASQTVECAYSDISGVHVRSSSQTATSQLTLKILEEKTDLIRCHRQYLINIKSIQEIKLLENGLAEIITLTGFEVPVSRRYLKTLKELLGLQ